MYASHQAALRQFEQWIEQERARLLAGIDKLLQPLVDKGKQYLHEYMEAEEKLTREKFSEN